jgi:hypothetical protein
MTNNIKASQQTVKTTQGNGIVTGRRGKEESLSEKMIFQLVL